MMASEIANLSDEELVMLTIRENVSYFEKLVTRYQKKLTRYVGTIIKKAADVDDIVQDTFISAFQNLKAFQINKKFSSWIYRIAHNKAINHIYKYKRIFSIDFDLDFNLSFFQKKDNTLEKIEKAELEKFVHDLLDKLDLKYKEVLVLHFMEEKSYQEIAEILRISPSNVGVRIKRAKEKLYQLIKSKRS